MKTLLVLVMLMAPALLAELYDSVVELIVTAPNT